MLGKRMQRLVTSRPWKLVLVVLAALWVAIEWHV
jgi:hypothetical protein